MNLMRLRSVAGLVLLWAGFAAAAESSSPFLAEPPTEPEVEAPARREYRHFVIAGRRQQGPLVIVHRGATAFAPENSLEAYAAAMDYGADGVEVDVRRTRDGVLVLFHDDMLDRLTDGFGPLNLLTLRDLLGLRPEWAFGRLRSFRPTTFAALLDLVRERHMLLHLDLKEPDLEEDLIRLLEAADAWDHVVYVNDPNSAKLRADPRYRPLTYKGPGLYEQRLDLDPEAVRAQLKLPGRMIMVDDPRVAARALQRPAHRPATLNKRYVLNRRPAERDVHPDSATFSPMKHLRGFTNQLASGSIDALLAVLDADFSEAGQAIATDLQWNRRAARIVERAWAAQQLGGRGRKSRRVVGVLEGVLARPTFHPDWRYHGLDAAMAVRALGRLRATESVPALIAFHRRQGGADAEDRSAASLARPAWFDHRCRMYVMAALGELRCRASRKFLRHYVAASEREVRANGPAEFPEATRALLQQSLTWTGQAGLLRNGNPAVRGTAIEECLGWMTDERQRALEVSVPWALTLPRAGR